MIYYASETYRGMYVCSIKSGSDKEVIPGRIGVTFFVCVPLFIDDTDS